MPDRVKEMAMKWDAWATKAGVIEWRSWDAALFDRHRGRGQLADISEHLTVNAGGICATTSLRSIAGARRTAKVRLGAHRRYDNSEF